MWKAILDRMPSAMVWGCTLLSLVIPYSMYKLNAFLHQIGDAPWSKSEGNGQNKQPAAGQQGGKKGP